MRALFITLDGLRAIDDIPLGPEESLPEVWRIAYQHELSRITAEPPTLDSESLNFRTYELWGNEIIRNERYAVYRERDDAGHNSGRAITVAELQELARYREEDRLRAQQALQRQAEEISRLRNMFHSPAEGPGRPFTLDTLRRAYGGQRTPPPPPTTPEPPAPLPRRRVRYSREHEPEEMP